MLWCTYLQVDSDRDMPDTPGIFRTQSFDMTVFDIRKVPPEQIAVSGTVGVATRKGLGVAMYCKCIFWKGVKYF